MEFQIGDNAGGYEIVGVLGAGGMGQVYKVRHLISDRLEAMKVVLPGRQEDAQLKERFEREIKVHASLTHPNIAALHTALWMGDRLLMIIELVDGVSLADRLRTGPMPVREAVECMIQALAALGYAHAHGVIHRDVKPANIMVNRAGVVKLTDFGIARAVRESTITQSGLAVGSLFYMSPEQIRSGPIDGRTDIYSAGVTLYEVITGQRPIQGDSDYAIMQAHLERQPVSPGAFVEGVPDGLSEAILKSLAKDPADRFQTAEEFQTALQSIGFELPDGGVAGIAGPMLARIERCLSQALGPIARPLVARTARTMNSTPELCRALAEHIPSAAERQSFLKCCETETGEVAAVRTPTGATRVQTTAVPVARREWPPQALDCAKKELAHHIGPLAKILVDKAAKRAQTAEQLIETLAQEIPDSRGREAFAAKLRRELG